MSKKLDLTAEEYLQRKREAARRSYHNNKHKHGTSRYYRRKASGLCVKCCQPNDRREAACSRCCEAHAN